MFRLGAAKATMCVSPLEAHGSLVRGTLPWSCSRRNVDLTTDVSRPECLTAPV